MNINMSMNMFSHSHTNDMLVASTMAPTSQATRAQTSAPLRRKKTHSLPPAAAHELDVMRAARQGIDISGMAPEERCKYPSKFCCHKRARKTTGKLHRFCEYHRTRARLNQKRWTDIRRRHDREHELVQSRHLLSSFADWSASLDRQQEQLIAAAAGMPSPLAIVMPKSNANTATKSIHSHDTDVDMPSSPTAVDVTTHTAPSPLSEDEIEQLMLLLQEEEEEEPSNAVGVSNLSGSVNDAFDMAWLASEWLDAVEFSSMSTADAFDIMPMVI